MPLRRVPPSPTPIIGLIGLIFGTLALVAGVAQAKEKWRPTQDSQRSPQKPLESLSQSQVATRCAEGSTLGAKRIRWECIIGAYHVIAHYKLPDSDYPEREHWRDWGMSFTAYPHPRDPKRFGNVEWRAYPDVRFSDPAGRFQKGHGASGRRVLEFWTPSNDQATELHKGVPIVRAKVIRNRLKPARKEKGSRKLDPCSWESAEAVTALNTKTTSYSYKMFVSCTERGLLFAIADGFAGGYQQFAGIEDHTSFTLFEVREVKFVPDLSGKPTLRLTGSYERDSEQHGRFTATRVWAGLGDGSIDVDAALKRIEDAVQREELWKP